MAQILRTETSLEQRQRAIGRELSLRKITRVVVWSIALALFVAGLSYSVRHATYGAVIAGAFALVCAAGYEVRLREIATESRHLEGGRRGERKMAERLAEQLADDHIILNDLDFRIAHERCQIDHLVVAPSGLYVIESKYWAGTLTGDVRDTQWTQIRSDGKTRIVKSPVLQVERQRRMFIAGLTAKVPDDRIYALAVFTHPASRLRITGGDHQALFIRDAIRFINDRCFDPPVLTPNEALALARPINDRQS
ncbi:MAG: nuclease-related domain-containing protein [Kiritimatiellae bacterium]|nr:nuclease-related domain-containing protein [Kiritimatiellia bacterium]